MRRIIMLVTVAGRRLAEDRVPFIGSRYTRVLVLSATLTAAVVVGLLGYATSSRADVACDTPSGQCLEKTATPDPVTVGEPLTFTIRVYCIPEIACGFSSVSGLTDTLPPGLEFVSASATGHSGPESGGRPQPTCSESAGTATCAPVAYWFDTRDGTEVRFVATIKVIPTQCGTSTNTASLPGGAQLSQSVSETFTVVGCVPTTVPTTKEQCKNKGWMNFENPDGSPMFKSQGDCVSYVATHGKNEPGQNVPKHA